MCLVKTPDAPEIPEIIPPPLPAPAAEKVELRTPQGKKTHERRKGKASLVIPRNTGVSLGD